MPRAIVLAIATVATTNALGAQQAPQSVDDARLAIATGRYAEAISYLEKAPRNDPEWAAGQAHLARVLALLSRFDDAERVARAAAQAPQQGREALTALGDVLLDRGRIGAADSAYRRAVATGASDSLMARFQLAVIAKGAGRRAEADSAFDRFIDVYNSRADRLTSREMMAVGFAVRELGAANPDLFKDALKALDRAVTLDPANLDARVAIGELFLAKYNSDEAQKSLDQVREINPAYPPALVASAARLVFDGQPGADSLLGVAVATSPEFVPARVMLARGMVDVERYADAAREAERALRTNPASVDALGVLATARFLAGDQRGADEARARAQALNPRDATVLTALGEGSARVRRYATAAEFARRAIAADPTAWAAHALLGTNLLRMGRIADGKVALDAAFKGDPYNVWVKNTLDLLDTFKNYDESTSANARYMIEKSESALLSVYLRDVTERAHVRFRQRYQYTPPEPVRIEVYRSHADFSVRTVGLAGIGALGVSFGTTLAFDSPAAKDAGPFNWASTVWHELAHTFTLGATDHRVPRWLSEGLSVWEEHQARPGWGAHVTPGFLEAFRTGKLVPVSRLNDGFMRPAYPEQIQHSYYQASLVCDLIVRDWGERAITGLLAEYRAGRTTEEAFQKVLSTDLRGFDRRFEAYVNERFGKAIAALAAPVPEFSDGMSAPQLVAQANQLQGSWRAQMLAATALMRSRQLDAAIPVLERAHALIPEFANDASPASLLARIHLDRGDSTRALPLLKQLAVGDEAAYDANIALAAVALSGRDTTTAMAALERAVYVNPFPVVLHQQLAALATARGDHALAVREREAIVALDPVDRADAYYQLAVAQRNAGNVAAAKRSVLRALEDAPNYARAQDLLLAIVDGRTP